LTPIDLTQQDYLRPTQLSVCRFRAQELLLDAHDSAFSGGGRTRFLSGQVAHPAEE
jgi:hypothetical protein